MGRPIKKSSADQSTVIRILDSTTFLPETAVEHDTSGIDLWYRREGAVKISITEAALASLDAAHADGGIEHIGDGYYRLDLPDAAVLTGANYVHIGGTVTGMVVIGNEHHLVAYDPQDTVRLGLTALPNAAANAAGGLPISDAGGLDLDAKLAATNEVTAARMSELDAGTGGKMANQVDIIQTDTTIDIPATITTITEHLTDIKGGTFSGATDSLEAIRDRGDAAWLTATGFSTLDANAVGDAVADEVYEGAVTLREAVRLILSILTGKTSGGGTSTLVFRDIGDTKNRVSCTVDADGNRIAVGTRNGS